MPIPQIRLKPLLFAAACAAIACPLAAQNAPDHTAAPPSSTPSFDVATVKLHPGMISVVDMMDQPDGLTGSAETLSALIANAYGMRSEDLLSGGPDWVKIDRFDIQAKISAGDVAELQRLSPADARKKRGQMLRALLEDRFKLQTHYVTKDAPIYELVVAKGGSKLKNAATDTTTHLETARDGKAWSGLRFEKDTSVAQAIALSAFTDMLSQSFTRLGRPVLDKTGLTGTYNFTLNWSIYSRPMAPSASAEGGLSDDGPTIFSALQEVGLKLQPATGPVKMLVVDHAERPTSD
jgi:uncharacterized protein (TIGR03435 family)